MSVLLLFVGLCAGAAIVWFLQESRHAGGKAQASFLESQLDTLRTDLAAERQAHANAATTAAQAEERSRQLTARLDNQRGELEASQRKLQAEFEVLANRILEEKTQRFTEQNRVNLDALLAPLGQKIGDFKNEVQHARLADTRERATLQEQIRALAEAGQRMTAEAHHLATALKGQVKMQGNWGELILETVLQTCGLTRDEHYRVQASLLGEDGRRYQPDVIVNLPDGRHLIVDSKVSLTAYERWCRAQSDGLTEECASALRSHLESLRQHISGLSLKKYHALPEVITVELVLMFIPVEPAYALAMSADAALLAEAHDKNICLVTPSTLLLALKTVASIWKQEKQARHALEIARQGGDLYDKFVGFCEDLKAIGERLDQARATHEAALNKLATGRGSLVSRAERLRELGVKSSKSLPSKLTAAAAETHSDEVEPMAAPSLPANDGTTLVINRAD
ncbi:MAG: DNA recombination protein RmuC [Verrucomicrobia bacterium]|nr:DNA recombination protein RmuC [Verrucomicrobiota bacterium]